MIGVLIILHVATGLITPYVLLQPLSAAPAGAAGLPAGLEGMVRLAVALLFVGGIIPAAIAIAAWPILGQRRPALLLWLLVVAGVSLAMQAVENQHFLSLLSLRLEQGNADAEQATVLAATAPLVRASWRWAHYTHLLSMVGWMLLFFGVLWHMSLVPRVLASLAMVTALMHLAGITLPVLLGYRVPFPLTAWGMPLGVAYLALAGWLLTKGLTELPPDSRLPAPQAS